MTALYGAIDLHSNNSVVVVQGAEGESVFRRRLPNELPTIVEALRPYQAALRGVVVESTFNWYWLVDGLMAAGYAVALANTTAIQQYRGLKYTDDDSDAAWLATLLRLGILPTGYIYPKAERGVRDLLRKRAHLVRQRTANVLSVQNLMRRSLGTRLSGAAIKALDVAAVPALMPEPDVARAMAASVAVLRCLNEQITALEQVVRARVKPRPDFRLLKTTPGIGDILALTILLETGDIRRFPAVGHFASYARCVSSVKLSNGKKRAWATSRTGTGISPGRFSKRRSSRSACRRRSNASTSASTSARTRSWRAKPWGTNSPGQRTTSCAIGWRSM
jgi:transposase